MKRILVGLGNPGPQYAGTRHNVGFDVLDRIALHEGLLFEPATSLRLGDAGTPLGDARGTRAFSVARSFDPDFLLVKPQGYMNHSGEAVGLVVSRSGVAPSACMVVYDDMDLPPGRLRIRAAGGHGGHNGMRSIVDVLGTQEFPRLRVGIGRSTTDAARHVLARFTDDERVEIEISVAEAAEAALDWLTHGDLEGCMTRFHSRWNQES
ncbi:MAG: aminoacyl-tRNA hydrolase [Planctomycetota bacterium]